MGWDMFHRYGMWVGSFGLVMVWWSLAGCSTPRPANVPVEPTYSFVQHGPTFNPPATPTPSRTDPPSPANLRLTIR